MVCVDVAYCSFLVVMLLLVCLTLRLGFSILLFGCVLCSIAICGCFVLFGCLCYCFDGLGLYWLLLIIVGCYYD